MTAQSRYVLVDADGVHIGRQDPPAPAAGEVQVRTSITGVCGSDVHAWHGRHPFVPLPYRPGHEVVGVVTAAGSAVDSVAVGARVTVLPPLPCWNCKMCRTGRENLCENLQFFGCGWAQGGMADVFTVDARRVFAVPDDLDDTAAALIEPLSTPVHAVRTVGGVAGRTVVVLGAGTIGLLVLGVARHQGASRIVVTDVRADKRERAARLGADAVIDASEDDAVDAIRAELGQSADVVFDCVANQHTVRDAISLANKGGTVAVVGVPGADVSIPLAIVQDHQIRIQGCATYLTEDYVDAAEILRSGGVRAADIVTADLPLDDAARGFDLAGSGEHVKVVLRP